MIRMALQRFMYGRYGNDQLNLFLLGVYFVLFLLAAITDLEFFALLPIPRAAPETPQPF